MLNPKQLSRRSFLKAGGATVLLPVLHSAPAAMAAKAAKKPDKKLVIMYIPNGIVRRQFFPGEGQAEIRDFIGATIHDKYVIIFLFQFHGNNS